MIFDTLPDVPEAQRWRQQAFPGPIVVALIKRVRSDGEHIYLLIHRNGRTHNGQWALVGGKWDFGEELVTAVLREVAEETALTGQFVALRGMISERITSTDAERHGAHFLIFLCEVIAPTGQAITQQEGDVAWFTMNDIDQLHRHNKIIPSDYQMMQQFANSTEQIHHYEVEMVSAIGPDKETPTELHRFDRID